MLHTYVSNAGTEFLDDHRGIRNAIKAFRIMIRDRQAKIYFGYLMLVIALAAFGPLIAPYPFEETMYTASGQPMLNEPPSLAHPLGTNNLGYDVLSRLIIGARPTVLTGLLGGTMIVGIGLTIGLTAGYVGGRVENILMRITDVAYGVPLLPTAMVLIALAGVGFFKSIVIIGLVLWRSTARVIRSQTLQIKERPFVLAAKTTGASTPSLIIKHILPNVGPMAVLFFASSTGHTIIVQAGLAFLGITNPFVPSWGIMVRNAYKAGDMAEVWWWAIPPGLMISFTVLSLFMFGRRYEVLLTGEFTEESMIG